MMLVPLLFPKFVSEVAAMDHELRKRGTSAGYAHIDVAAAAKDAGVTAVLAFFLLLPLIGFKTVQNIHNELELETRWTLLFVFVAIATVGRLLYSLTIVPWLERRALRARQPGAAASPLRATLARWSAPLAIGFVLVYPPLVLLLAGFGGAAKWVDNF